MGLLEEAVDVGQYNSSDMDWASEGGSDTPQRTHMSRVIGLRPEEVAGKSVLDVGCGLGWFLRECVAKGAEQVVGLEPADYARVTEGLVPGAEILKRPFEDFDAKDDSFDLVSFIMSTEHIADMPKALEKATRLLRVTGKLIILTGDFDAFQAERLNYRLETEVTISDREAVVRVERPFGTLTDIVRSVDYWSELIETAGLRVTEHAPVTADPQYISEIPKYEIYADTPFLQLFRAEKTSR